MPLKAHVAPLQTPSHRPLKSRILAPPWPPRRRAWTPCSGSARAPRRTRDGPLSLPSMGALGSTAGTEQLKPLPRARPYPAARAAELLRRPTCRRAPRLSGKDRVYNRTVVHLAKGQGQPRSTGITPLIADGRRYSTRPRSLLVNGPRAEVEAVLKTVSILGL